MAVSVVMGEAPRPALAESIYRPSVYNIRFYNLLGSSRNLLRNRSGLVATIAYTLIFFSTALFFSGRTISLTLLTKATPFVLLNGIVKSFILSTYIGSILFFTTVLTKSLYEKFGSSVEEIAKINSSIDVIQSNSSYRLINSTIHVTLVCASLFLPIAPLVCAGSLLQIGAIGIGAFLIRNGIIFPDMYETIWREERVRLQDYHSFGGSIWHNFLHSVENRDNYGNEIQHINDQHFDHARRDVSAQEVKIIKSALAKYRDRVKGTKELSDFEEDLASFSGNSIYIIARESIVEIFSTYSYKDIKSGRRLYPSLIKLDEGVRKWFLQIHKDFAKLKESERAEVLKQLHADSPPQRSARFLSRLLCPCSNKVKKVWKEIRGFSSQQLIQGNFHFNAALQKALA
jgi:hypothetical protein